MFRITNIIFLLLTICYGTAVAQYSEGRLIYEDGNDLRNIDVIVSADLDQDGMEDVLFAAYDTGRLAWFKNYGDGQFSSERIIDDHVKHITSLEVVDLNSDELPDLLATDYVIGRVMWYPNLGQGQFGSPQTIHINPPYIGQATAADIDNDGDNDVVIRDGGIFWHENNGNGTFDTEHHVNPGNPCYEPTLVDIDSDGQIDMVCPGAGDRIYTFKNENGIFSLLSIIQSTLEIQGEIYLRDIDGDSDTDLIAKHYLNGDSLEFLCFVNEGDELALAPPVSLGVISGSFYPQLLIDDLNDDGLPDIVPIGSDVDYSDFSITSIIGFYENSGSLSFLEGDTIVQSDIFATAITTGDLNGDQKVDFIFANFNRINWIDHSAFTDGYSGMGLVSDSGQALRMTSELEIGKINNGNTSDIVFSALDYNTETLEYISINNLGNGNFGEPSGLFSDTQLPFSNGFQLADIDDDGVLDIFSAWKDGRLSWYKGDGLGGFNDSRNDIDIPEVDMMTMDKVADMDNDGAVDLICTASIGNWDYPYILFNDGQGNFNNYIQFSEADYFAGSKMELNAGDLDNDGDPDLIGLARSSDLIAFYILNNGDGTFDDVVDLDLNLPEGYSPTHRFDLADMDGDGDVEVFVAYATSIPGCGSHGLPCPFYAYLIFDLDNGQLTLVNAINSFPFGASYSIIDEHIIKYEDFNLDGYADILSVSPERTRIQWLLGDGNGFFDETIHVADGLNDYYLNLHSLWPVDIDNDLDLDVLALEYDAFNMVHKLRIYENTDQDLDGDNDGFDIVADCDDSNPNIGDELPTPYPGDDAEICEGDQYQFTGHIVPGADYVWIGPNGYVSYQAQPVIEEASSYNSGTYSLIIYLNDCVSDTGTVELNVLDEPSVSIGWVDGVLTSGPGGLSYQWYLNDTIIDGATMQDYTPVESGDYHVAATDADGCSGSSGVVSVAVTALPDHSISGRISVYPNPAQFTINIEFPGNLPTADYRLFNVIGEMVQEGQLSGQANSILLQPYQAGTYFLEINSGEGNYSGTVIIIE